MSYRNEAIKDKESLAREYIKEAGEAGKRVRFVLGIIVTASILAFAGFWNSLPGSWKKQRLITLERLNTYLNLNMIEEMKAKEKQVQNEPANPANDEKDNKCNEKEDDKEIIKKIIGKVSENYVRLLRWEQKDKAKIIVSDLIPKYVDDENMQRELRNKLNEKIDEWYEKTQEAKESQNPQEPRGAQESQKLNKADIDSLTKGIIDTINNYSTMFVEANKDKFSKKVKERVEKSIEDAYKNTQKELEYAIEYYKPFTLGKAGIENLLQKYNDFEVENVKTIQVPFFGISFDVNELGFIGGLSFLVLMIILYASLKREHENLRFVSGFIKGITEKEIKFSLYRLMSMNQLLSMTSLPLPLNQGDEPNKESSEEIKKPNAGKHKIQEILTSIKKWIATQEAKYYYGKIFSHIPKILFFLPLGLFAWIVINDFLTLQTGKQISSINTRLSLIGAIIFMVLLGIYTIRCLKATSDVDEVWDGIRIYMKGEDKPKDEEKSKDEKKGTSQVAVPPDGVSSPGDEGK